MPKRLIRSILNINGLPNPENLRVNFRRLSESGLEWQEATDKAIFKFVAGHFQIHLDCPSIQIVSDYFQAQDDIETIERLKDVRSAELYERNDFAALLGNLLESQNQVRAVAVLRDAQDIITKGLTFGQGKNAITKKGIKEAIQFASESLHPLVIEENTAQTRGDLRADTRAGWDDYQVAKLNKDKAVGKFTGIDKIDNICHGIKRGELWVHAGFTAELKSTFAMNWGYNLITRYRSNVLYVSLEMPYTQIRRQLHTIHTTNLLFENQGLASLDYERIRYGDLTPSEEAFYQMALNDLETNPEYCSFEAWCPDHDVTIADIRTYAEILHKKKDVGMIVIDHGGLVQPLQKHKEYVIGLNSVLRDGKKLALHFNHGEGVPVLMLFQLNRTGKTEADKSDGVYKMNALSYANEAERSADVVTTTYLNDDHRSGNTTKFCHLKNRAGKLFSPFIANTNLASLRIFNAELHNASGMSIDSDDMTAISSGSV